MSINSNFQREQLITKKEQPITNRESHSKKSSNIEIKFDHINNNILVLKDSQSIIKIYNTDKSGNVFSDLDKILYLLETY